MFYASRDKTIKTERVVLLTTPEFKAFLALEANREGVSVAKRAGETLKDVAKEMREHDRRIRRLEVPWDTALAPSRTGQTDITPTSRRIVRK